VSGEREVIMDLMRDRADFDARKIGVQVLDVRLKRVDLPQEVSEAVYRRMEAERKRVANELRSLGFAEGSTGKGRILSKTATAAIVYSSDGLRGMKEDPETYYFIPQEGGRIWVDNIAIVSRAPNRDMAEKFINHILYIK
jgi:spermidine/putrescine-binding protein